MKAVKLIAYVLRYIIKLGHQWTNDSPYFIIKAYMLVPQYMLLFPCGWAMLSADIKTI